MGEKDGQKDGQQRVDVAPLRANELDARIREALIVARAAQRETPDRRYALVVTKLEEAVLWLHAPGVLA